MSRWKQAAAVAAAAWLSYWASGYAIDFSVYWTIAKSAVLGSGSLYGGASGMPWPMWYRYPPLFAYLVAPLALLPFRQAAFVWALGKVATAAVAARAYAPALRPAGSRFGWVLALLIAAPYVAFELRYGNAQFYVFALTAYALWRSRTKPGAAGAALGLAVAFKLWPLFFVPYLVALRRTKTAAVSLAAAVLLTLLPAAIVGWSAHARDLEDWYVQEYRIAARADQIWFPSQSLLGVMSRHLSDIDYRSAPDPNYPLVNRLHFHHEDVRRAWRAIAVLGYAALLLAAWRWKQRDELALHAAAFCALILLEPYAQRQSTLVVLAFPAAVAAANWTRLRLAFRGCVLLAAALSLAQLLTPSGYWQRVYQVWGFDALLTLLLLVAAASLLSAQSSRLDKQQA